MTEPAKTGARSGWLSLAIPLVMLAAEVGLLTWTVEYKREPMATLASPRVGQALMLAGTLLLLLRGADLARVAVWGRFPARIAWLAVHSLAFIVLLQLSVTLAEAPQAAATSTIAWSMLMPFVGVSAVLAAASWGTLQTWIEMAWHQITGVLLLGGALAWITPDIQQSWRALGSPTVTITYRLLAVAHSERAYLNTTRLPDPIVGLYPGNRLLVTPGCAEMESLAALLLLASVLLVVDWRNVRWERWLAAVALGMVLLFCLNAVRIALLVEIGEGLGGTWSVHAAHSRLGSMTFLAVSAAWLALARRWWSTNDRSAAGR